MSDCCDDDECAVPAAAEACGACGERGVAVDRITLKALLTPGALRRGFPPNPRFCASPECPIVYFDPQADMRFTEDDLLVPVHAKHPGDPDVPVCYCFGVTRRSVVAHSSRDIAAEVRAGHCACEVRNPKGSCCLGDVVRIEQEVGHGGAKQTNE